MPRRDVVADMLSVYRKKAKIDQETSVEDESLFLYSAVGRHDQSFASLEHSFAETSANGCHFRSSPRRDESFIRTEDDKIKHHCQMSDQISEVGSPLRRMDENGSSYLRPSFMRSYDKQTLSLQDRSSHRSDHRSVKHYFQHSTETSGNLFGERSVAKKPASSLNSQELTTGLHTAAGDANSRGSIDITEVARTALSYNKWWAFVSGMTPLPG